jgi:CRP-like cAMP-binding protein
LGSSTQLFDPAALAERLRTRARADGVWHARDQDAGTILFAAGDPSTQLWVLESGLVKLHYLTAAGEDWVKSFIADRGLFTASGDLAVDGVARFGATCLEPCRVAAIPLTWLDRSLTTDRDLQGDFARFAAWLQARKQRREEALLCRSAEQRYRDFCAADGGLAARLHQADIARYIGITPVALSRIRRRLGLTGTTA